MELYLVKEHIKTSPISQVLSRTTKHNGALKKLNCIHRELFGTEDKNKDDDNDRTLLTLTDLPVALTSICNDVNWHSEKFAKRVEKVLTKKSLSNIQLEVTSNDENSWERFCLLTGLPDKPKIDILERLEDEFNCFDVKFKVELSMSHLPGVNVAVSPWSLSLITLTDEHAMVGSIKWRHFGTTLVPVPSIVKKWCDLGTGFIYSKLSIKVTFGMRSVARVYEFSPVNSKMLNDSIYSDVEMECKTGEISKCHRSILASRTRHFEDKFEEMLKKGKEVGPWKLDMNMSEDGVKALLEYIYCNEVTQIVESCDVAVELLEAACEYGVCGLENAVEEIIMAKCSSDFGYFSVKNGVDLFLQGRNAWNQKHWRDKGVRVLQNYLKTKGVKLVESKEYQDLFKKWPVVAVELSKLYFQIK